MLKNKLQIILNVWWHTHETGPILYWYWQSTNINDDILWSYHHTNQWSKAEKWQFALKLAMLLCAMADSEKNHDDCSTLEFQNLSFWRR